MLFWIGTWTTAVTLVLLWEDISVPSAEPNTVSFLWNARFVVSNIDLYYNEKQPVVPLAVEEEMWAITLLFICLFISSIIVNYLPCLSLPEGGLHTYKTLVYKNSI